MNAPGKKNDQTRKGRDYIQYTGMAFQMIVLLAVAAFIGQKLDAWMKNETPWFTAALALIALMAYFVKLYYDLK